MAVHIASKLPSTDIAAFSVHPGSMYQAMHEVHLPTRLLGIASNLQRHVDSESISDARVKSQNSGLTPVLDPGLNGANLCSC